MTGFEEFSEWFQSFCEFQPLFIVGDSIGTTFLCSGSVILTLAALSTRSAALAAMLTGLPSGFTEAVIAALVKMAFWRSQEALDLEKTIRLRGGELAEV
jgi:hypothetical protein